MRNLSLFSTVDLLDLCLPQLRKSGIMETLWRHKSQWKLDYGVFFFFLIGNKSIIKKTIKLRSDDTIGCQG